jgi:glycosyltransferase involved in cell wall biosynthesis
MHIAMLSPIAWRTPPRHYGPWENVASLITEGLVSCGHEVTLFATADSQTSGTLHAVCPRGYEEDRSLIPKVWECLHISELFEHADEFDIIHNHFDFLPLTYTGLTTTPVVTTIHGFSSPGILPVYKKYNGKSSMFPSAMPTDRRILITLKPSITALISGNLISDQYVAPHLDNDKVIFAGSVGPIERNHLLGNACALLHPIQFDEPFGLSVIESMACGTPVIAFNRGSMPELIENGQNGFLVNNVVEAVETVARIKEIDRAYCRRHIERHFTVDRMINEYIQVYEMILSPEAGRGGSC